MKASALAISFIGTWMFAIALALCLQQNEAHVLSRGELIGYGAVLTLAVLLIAAGLRFGTWKAAIVDVVVVILYFVTVHGAIFGTSIGRARQRRTMADMRSLATALEARADDMKQYPAGSSIDSVATLLEPTYLRRVPRRDGWGSPWRYEVWKVDPKSPGPDHYAIGSAGRDLRFEKTSLVQYSQRAITDYDCDIVYRDGAFVTYPEGTAAEPERKPAARGGG